MRRLLVVSYYAPPLGLSGVMRVTKLCKYLPDFGWEPLVLTAEPPAYFHYDERLLEDLGRSRVFRTESLDPGRLLNRLRPRGRRNEPVAEGTGRGPARLASLLLYPDSKVGWVPFALRRGLKLIEEERPNAVFATAPPFSALLLGLRFKARGHLPLIADFRDPWPTGFRPPPAHQRAALERMRRYVARKADAVLAVNEGTARAIGPGVEVLDNGFDPEDFRGEPERLEGFSILHVGNPWQNEAEFERLARALAALPEARLYLAGLVSDRLRQALAGNVQVRLLGVVDHDRACRLMRGAGVLLYVGKPGQPVGIKLYEYLGSGRPIVVCGPDAGEAAGLVTGAGAGLAVGRVEDVPAALAQLRAGSFAGSDRSRFDRRQQAGRLAELAERLVVGRPAWSAAAQPPGGNP